MDKAIEMLTDRELYWAHQFALDEIRHSKKEPNDDNYVARCWVKGVVRALQKTGKKLCIKSELEVG